MKLAYLSPLAPVRSGIAHYSSMLLDGLVRVADVTCFVRDSDLDGARAVSPEWRIEPVARLDELRDEFDAVICQLGNNPHHDWIYREAWQQPGVIVLHDLVLHHLIVEMTLARGDVDGYVAALAASHGEAGAAWARGRAIGLHTELANFLLPASIEVANRSRAVIVHNRYAFARLRDLGVTTPIHIVPHPFEEEPDVALRRAPMRASLGFRDDDRVIGLFGFLTSAKRAEIALDAFARARRADPRLRLLIVGEPAPNIDVDALVQQYDLPADAIAITGYVDDAQFSDYFAAIDRLVNLRYPTAGETSGTLIRAFAIGLPVAVSDYAQFADLPDSCVTKIAFGDDETTSLTAFLLREIDRDAIAAAQRQWLDANARLDLTIAGYLRAIGDARRSTLPIDGPRRTFRALPLFPRMTLVGYELRDRELHLVLRNDGDARLRTRAYGEPGYRLIAKLFRDGRELFDRWLELPRDLAPGEETSVVLELPPLVEIGDAAITLKLFDAIESIPMLDPEPFATEVLARAAV